MAALPIFRPVSASVHSATFVPALATGAPVHRSAHSVPTTAGLAKTLWDQQGKSSKWVASAPVLSDHEQASADEVIGRADRTL